MDQKVARCLLIAKVLVADGIMTENEHAFLDTAMSGMGLDAADKRRVFDLDGWDEAEPILAALSEEDKREIVSGLVDAAAVDGRLSPLEMATVKRISAALGLD